MVTSRGNYSIELHRGSPKSLPILPNLLLPSQTVKVRENYVFGHTAFSEFDSHLRNVFGVWIDLDKFYEILFFILLLEPKGIFPEYDKSAPLGRDASRDMREIQDQGQLWNRQLLAFFFVGG